MQTSFSIQLFHFSILATKKCCAPIFLKKYETAEHLTVQVVFYLLIYKSNKNRRYLIQKYDRPKIPLFLKALIFMELLPIVDILCPLSSSL